MNLGWIVSSLEKGKKSKTKQKNRRCFGITVFEELFRYAGSYSIRINKATTTMLMMMINL